MRTWGITDIGLVRKENQDAYDIRLVDNYTAAVVCDGMGGTNGGRLASTTAVETFQKKLGSTIEQGMSAVQLQQLLSYTVSLTNDALHKIAQEDEAYQYMGTTLVTALACDAYAVIANVGDSRAYHITQDGIFQISHDHSMVEQMVERGELTPEQAKHHPNRNFITRALGPDESVDADCFYVEWKQGDFILLCTDGLVNTVSDQEIWFETVQNQETDTCLERLLALAKQNGAPDNVTAVLLLNS